MRLEFRILGSSPRALPPFALVLGRSGNDLLSRVLRHSTIGAEAFNGRVRDGIGFGRLAQVTGPAKDKMCWPQAPAGPSGPLAVPRIGAGAQSRSRAFGSDAVCDLRSASAVMVFVSDDPRTWIMGAMKPIGRLVPVSSTRHRACTPGLSTWSSSTALKGELVSRWVSRLDAFSGYPVRT